MDEEQGPKNKNKKTIYALKKITSSSSEMNVAVTYAKTKY